jgi:hypothetical protein
MKVPALQKVAVALASDILAKCEPTEDGQKLAQPGMTPARYVEAAIAAGLFTDAIRFLAFALPIREAVWWACLTVRDSLAGEPAVKETPVLEAVEAWVYKPVDANRRAVFAKGEVAGFDIPAGYLALGAFWSGGSMAPPGNPEVPPDPALAPNAVAAAVLISAVAKGPQGADDRYRRSLARAINIANGGDGRQV